MKGSSNSRKVNPLQKMSATDLPRLKNVIFGENMSNHVKLIHLSRGNILLFMCLVPQLLSVSHTIILTPARVHLVTYFIFFFSHPSESSTPSGINSVDNSYTPILKVPLAPLVPVLCFPYELDRWPTLCTSCP